MIVESYTASQRELLDGLARAVANEELYLVGGAVRDILLQRECNDIDFIVLPELTPFLERLTTNWSEFVPHIKPPKDKIYFKKYRTAKLIFADELPTGGHLLEFAGARRESYSAPGVEPVVERGTLEQDLMRRDFSVNALAAGIAGNRCGELVDICGGVNDLRAKSLRALHPKSFEDDPMRIIRGVRLAVRLGFSFDSGTHLLLEKALETGLIGRVRPQRRFEELRKAVMEPQWLEVVARLNDSGCLQGMFPGLQEPKRLVASDDWVTRFVSLCPDPAVMDQILLQAGVAHVGKFHEAYERFAFGG